VPQEIIPKLHLHRYTKLGPHPCRYSGRPRLRYDSHEARSTVSLDPRKSPTRTTQGQVGRPPILSVTYSLTEAFNATTSTYVATAPKAWEQHPCQILLFTAHPGMDDEKLPLFTP
jgi:hypothetical protein